MINLVWTAPALELDHHFPNSLVSGIGCRQAPGSLEEFHADGAGLLADQNSYFLKISLFILRIFTFDITLCSMLNCFNF